MTLDRVNYVNMGLMVASLVAALVLPFELFLFSYAVLGPLHYLTEISWLHDRKYFVAERSQVWPIVVLTVLSFLSTGLADFLLGLDEPITPKALEDWNAEAAFAALFVSLVLVVAKTPRARWVGSLAVLAAAVVGHFVNAEIAATLDYDAVQEEFLIGTSYDRFFMVFLTTIIHVFVFTAAFVLFGALKSKSGSGHISFFVMMACAVACFLVPVATSIPQPSEYTFKAYRVTAQSLNYLLYCLVDQPVGQTVEQAINQVYMSESGVKIARFISFAYTYHYLNWFSKTSVIKWHEVSRLRSTSMIVIWLVSVGIYGVDYTLGLFWLFFLSMLHVFLEFPLNWHSFVGIGQELIRRAKPS